MDKLVEERFFIEHGMIHDRVTGKHVSTETVEYGEGQFDESPTAEACALLNELAAIAQKRVNELEVALTDARNNILSLLGGFRDDMPDVAVKLFQAQARQIEAALPTMLKGNGDG